MKHFFLSRKITNVILLLLLSLNSFAQNSFIETKDNTKIIVDESSVDVRFMDEAVDYKLPNSSEMKIIRFKEIQSANIGGYKMNRMIIGNEKKERLCMTILDTNDKKLIGYNRITHGGSYGKTYAESFYFILDNENNILDKTETNDLYGSSYAKDRKKAEEILTKHFSDCKALMFRLTPIIDTNNPDAKYSKSLEKWNKKMEERNYNIIRFFERPKYLTCSSVDEVIVKTPEASSTSTTTETPTYSDENYNILVVSIDAAKFKDDVVVKGTHSIKEGYYYFQTRAASLKAKIISYENGILKTDVNGYIETLTISKESGKKKGYEYDTKITVIDNKFGGSQYIYWCKKE